MIDKNWIDNNCLTKNGTLNNRVVIESWWHNRGFGDIYGGLCDMKISQEHSTITETLYGIYTGISSGTCKMCNKETKFINFKDGYRNYCSVRCSTQCPDRNQKISLAERDTVAIQEKMKNTCMERYGVEYAAKIIVEKSRQTKLMRYGNATYNNHDKAKSTCQEKYGVEYSCHIPDKIEKTKETRASKIPQLRNKQVLLDWNKTHTLEEISDILNVTASAVSYWFKYHGILPEKHYRTISSRPQEEIYNFCESLGFTVINNDRQVISPKEVDILIPEMKLAIEMNGIYWHKEKPTQHIEKMESLIDNGYRCIQFWDDEWKEKNEICKSILYNALGLSTKIYGRKCQVRNISNNEYKQFCENNHIHGYAPASIRIGTFYNDQLVSVMGIVKSRYDKNYEYEISRSCTLLNHNVIGGFSKMLKYANISSLISYCDRRLHTGNGYHKNGFVKIRTTKPNYFYWNERTKSKISRIAAQKHKLNGILEIFDDSITEHDNMLNNGWYRVYDCGNSVWALPQS